MNKKDLYELMDRFEISGLQSLKLRDGDFSLELKKPEPAAAVPPPPPPPPFPGAAYPVPLPDAIPVPTSAPAPAEEGELVRAPLVGTFYTAPNPGEAPYVRPGDRVEKGATLCLIEAMKTMSEIPAPCDLVVEAVLAENGSLVAYDAPLVRYRHV